MRGVVALAFLLIAAAIGLVLALNPARPPAGCSFISVYDAAYRLEVIAYQVATDPAGAKASLLATANCMRGIPADGNGPNTADRGEQTRSYP